VLQNKATKPSIYKGLPQAILLFTLLLIPSKGYKTKNPQLVWVLALKKLKTMA
jgi:hypothetical protein